MNPPVDNSLVALLALLSVVETAIDQTFSFPLYTCLPGVAAGAVVAACARRPEPAAVIGALTAIGDGNPVAMIDQLVTMVFIWLGVAIGFASLGVAVSFNEPDALYPMLGVAAFPGFIGLALIALSFISRGK